MYIHYDMPILNPKISQMVQIYTIRFAKLSINHCREKKWANFSSTNTKKYPMVMAVNTK